MADLVLPPGQTPLADNGGFATHGWRRFFEVAAQRLGSGVDNVALALGLAKAAVPQSTEIVAVAPLAGGGYLNGNVLIQFGIGFFAVADLPDPGLALWAYATDGRKTGEGAGTGTGVWTWSDGNAWYSIMGGTVAA